MASTAHLPLDIIHTILLNLPVKSLLIFKTVCKSWNAIISDLRFAKLHHQNSKNSNPHNLFLTGHILGRSEVSLVKFENKNLHVKEVLQDSVPKYPFDNVLCYGDGLVLLETTSGGEHVCVLWNPSIRKQTIIRYPSWCDIRYAKYGICHDPSLNDYKIIAICKEYYVVFSCNDRTWTKKQNITYNIRDSPHPPLFVDGFTFWSALDSTQGKEVLYFDYRDNKFKKLHKPKLLENTKKILFCETRLRGRLCLYDIVIRGMVVKLRIWMLEGHVDLCNWSEELIIDYNCTRVDDIMVSAMWLWPICFTEENEIVVQCERGVMVYSPLRKTFEKYCGIDYFTYGAIIPYLDSLFFPIQIDKEAEFT